MPLSDYEVVIGLEVHAQLQTATKLFCGCSTEFGQVPNSQVCPVCLGMPGALPRLNEQALDYTIAAGLAFNCEIASYSKFDRKQYFYPDLPKAYQISQYDLPICRNGWLEIFLKDGSSQSKRVGITRIHLEEEAGKTVHSGTGILDSDYAMLDYNRAGIPLVEIVGAPELSSPQEARLYLEKLKLMLAFIGISDCKMEEGSLRCDANISLRPKGQTELGVLTELKNMNSFKAVEAALDYEAIRQAQLLGAGERLVKETRTWDETKGVTRFMRFKEETSDYRYFPEPDLLPVQIDVKRIERMQHFLPELPDSRRKRYLIDWKLPEYDAEFISSQRHLAEFFERVVASYPGEAKTVSNWIMGELSRLLNQAQLELTELKFTVLQFVRLLTLVDEGIISGKTAKTVFEEMFFVGGDPEQIVKEQGLMQISDPVRLKALISKVLEDNPKSIADYLSGKQAVFGFLVGQVMRETKGRANPSLVNQLLRDKLESLD